MVARINDSIVWRSFTFCGEPLKRTTIETQRITLPDCTDKGEPLTKKQLGKAEYKFYKADGTEYTGTNYKLINGKAQAKTEMTKEVAQEQVKVLDNWTLPYDLIYDSEHLVQGSPSFTDKMAQAKNYFVFPFNSGYGYKPTYAVMFYDNIAKAVVMRLAELIEKKLPLRSQAIDLKLQRVEQKQQAKKQLKKLQGEQVETIQAEELIIE